jgi:hypothetical protein
MTNKTKYILDANIFIEAKNRYYAFDLCPGFWDSLIHHFSIGNLESIDRVGKELSDGDDILSDWKKMISSLFVSTNNKLVIEAYGDIIKWALSQDYKESAKSDFAKGVDAWVIAHAKANNATVVTHEASAPNSIKRIKIPDVCKHFGIRYTNTFDMLKKLEIVFNWEK